MQHAHICKLIDHPPVVTPALCLSTLPTLNAQVDGVKIPEGNRKKVIASQDNNITVECKASECLHLLLEQKPTSFLQCNRAQLFTHQLIKDSHISWWLSFIWGALHFHKPPHQQCLLYLKATYRFEISQSFWLLLMPHAVLCTAFMLLL